MVKGQLHTYLLLSSKQVFQFRKCKLLFECLINTMLVRCTCSVQVGILSMQVSILSIQAGILSMQVSILSMQAGILSMQVSILSMQAGILSMQVSILNMLGMYNYVRIDQPNLQLDQVFRPHQTCNILLPPPPHHIYLHLMR